MYELLESESVCTPPLPAVRAGLCFAAAANAEARAEARRAVSSDCACRASMAFVGVPRRVILNFGELSGRTVVRGVGGNGAFCMPGFGDIRSFCVSGGMWSVVAIVLERSSSVEVEGRVRVCGLLWWWIVSVRSSVSAILCWLDADMSSVWSVGY